MKLGWILGSVLVGLALSSAGCGKKKVGQEWFNGPNNRVVSPAAADGEDAGRSPRRTCHVDAGCGLGSGFAGSCTGADGMCTDHNGGLDSASWRERCESGNGRFSASPCPASGLIGSCKVNGGTSSETILRFYQSMEAYSVESVRAFCSDERTCMVYCGA